MLLERILLCKSDFLLDRIRLDTNRTPEMANIEQQVEELYMKTKQWNYYKSFI